MVRIKPIVISNFCFSHGDIFVKGERLINEIPMFRLEIYGN